MALSMGIAWLSGSPSFVTSRRPSAVDNGMYKYDISWEAVKTSGEDEIYSISFM
jgi:hypothetical protein